MSRPTFFLLALCPLLAGCLRVRPESLVPAGAVSHAADASEYLTGRAANFAVLGDAGSLVWPELLQDLLNTHARIGGVYRVESAALMESAAQHDDEALRGALERSFSRTGAPTPRNAFPETVLCQVSLRGIGDERGPVKSEHDMVGAEMGADALQRLALALRDLGAKRVLFATSPHEQGADPELGLERVALERLLARGLGFVAAGPNLNAATRRYFPDAYLGDGVHLNEFGTKLMAEEWYRCLAGPEAREEVVEALYAQDYDVEAIEAAQLERAGFNP